jgi:hypothetical protein
MQNVVSFSLVLTIFHPKEKEERKDFFSTYVVVRIYFSSIFLASEN